MGSMDIAKYGSLGFMKPDEREVRRSGPSPGLTSGSAPDKVLQPGLASGSAPDTGLSSGPASDTGLPSASASASASELEPSINLANRNLTNSVSGNQANTGRPQPKKAELEQICSEFAAIFFRTLLKSMYSTIPKSSLCPEFQGKNLVNSVIDQGVSQFMASQDAAGLKESLLRMLVSGKE